MHDESYMLQNYAPDDALNACATETVYSVTGWSFPNTRRIKVQSITF